MKKFKIDKNFIPCPVSEDDEIFQNGIFEFNITKLTEFIKSNPDIFIPETIVVKEYYEGTVNEDHMPNVVISEPVILAEIAPGRFNVIDGNHRMEKARRKGIENIKAYRVYAIYHQKFLTNKEAYISYVNYWNDKLKDM
jgi:hypothetical protein